MTTLLLCPALYVTTGGIERMMQLYLDALRAGITTGDRVRVAALNDPVLPSARLADCEALLAGNGRKFAFSRRVLRLAAGCDRILCGHLHLLPLAMLAGRLNPRLRVAVVAHGIEAWEIPRWVRRWAQRRVERILCVSEFTRETMLRLDPGLDRSRLTVVPNTVPATFLAAGADAGASPAEPRLVCVTRLSAADAYKGVDHLIAAFAKVAATLPEASLHIVGDGDDRPRLQALATSSPAAARIHFKGRISDEALFDELRACRAFVLPSEREGFGLVYLEAMAFGRPCIGAAAGGVPEVITPETGRLVPYGDTEALARTCIEVLQATWEPERLRARARKFAPDKFRERFLTAWPTP